MASKETWQTLKAPRIQYLPAWQRIFCPVGCPAQQNLQVHHPLSIWTKISIHALVWKRKGSLQMKTNKGRMEIQIIKKVKKVSKENGVNSPKRRFTSMRSDQSRPYLRFVKLSGSRLHISSTWTPLTPVQNTSGTSNCCITSLLAGGR